MSSISLSLDYCFHPKKSKKPFLAHGENLPAILYIRLTKYFLSLSWNRKTMVAVYMVLVLLVHMLEMLVHETIYRNHLYLYWKEFGPCDLHYSSGTVVVQLHHCLFLSCAHSLPHVLVLSQLFVLEVLVHMLEMLVHETIYRYLFAGAQIIPLPP